MKRRIIYEYNLIHVYLPKLMLVVILSEFLNIMWLIMTYNVFFTLSIVLLFVRPVLSGQPVLSGHPSCTTAYTGPTV